MIVQEINLYQERFKEKKIWLSALHMIFLAALTIVILAYSSYWYNAQYDQAELANKEFIVDKEQSTQQLEDTRNKLQALLDDNQLEQQITKVSSEIAAKKRVMNFVSNNRFSSGAGFSKHLSGLSEITISNVWLNEISLAENYLKLSGSALKAEKIPEYFNKFRQHQLFDGRVFEIFELDRDEEQAWKVDFLIASRAAANE